MKDFSFDPATALKKNKHVCVYKVVLNSKTRIVKLVKIDGAIPNSNYKCELNHPNVIRCFEKGTTEITNEKFYYSILEYANNNCIEKNSNEFKRNPLNFINDILKGLKCLHDNNIIHGDLKPGNILIEGSGKLMVCKISDYNSTTGENNKFFVTPEIIAPEWTRTFNAQTDIWAFGILLYKLFVGQYPFGSRSNGENFNQIIDRILNQPLNKTDIFKIEEPYRWIIYRCLQKNPNQRFKNIQEILEELHPRPNLSKITQRNIGYLKGALVGHLR